MAATVLDMLVLVPDQYGALNVVSIEQLLGHLDEEWSDEVLTDSAIDQQMSIGWNADQAEQLAARVQKYNATGDIDAYWNPTE